MTPSTLRFDPAATRDRRRALLAQLPLTATLSEAHRASLLAASSLATCAVGTTLFDPGDPPRDVFLLGSGFVQILLALAPDVSAGETRQLIHLRFAAQGELVGDRELVSLATGAVGTETRRHAARVAGEPTEIMAIRQSVLARVLAEDPAARTRVATEALRDTDALERLASELALLKSFGKVRLARFLLELFDRMGRLRGGRLEVGQAFSHADLAGMLGLTRRSVFDDMLALEDFDAVDHDRSGRLVLCNRGRLVRIAGLGQAEGREESAASWHRDIEAALAAGDTLHAFELAREALLYHPRDAALRYDAVLAALRAGAQDEADALIAAFKFSVRGGAEREAALAARSLKERAFASLDSALMRDLAGLAASAYWVVQEGSGGAYPTLNAAAMYYLAGEADKGDALARPLACLDLPKDAGYWDLATRAEALWLLGKADESAREIARAHACPDADDGKRSTTRRQFRRLSTALARDASPILSRLKLRPVLVACTPPQQAAIPALLAMSPARLLVAVTDKAQAAAFVALRDVAGVELVLSAPAEGDEAVALSPFVCHLADEAGVSGPAARWPHAWRHALGFGCLLAAEREAAAPLLVDSGKVVSAWPAWAAPDAMAESFSAVLWLEGGRVLASALEPAAAEWADLENSMIFRFTTLRAALQAAFSAQARARTGDLQARICLDVERLEDGRLGSARLHRLQPLSRPAEVSATRTAAAEIALLRSDTLRLTPIGRVRSQRRLSRLRLWAVRRSAAWG